MSSEIFAYKDKRGVGLVINSWMVWMFWEVIKLQKDIHEIDDVFCSSLSYTLQKGNRNGWTPVFLLDVCTFWFRILKNDKA